MGDEIETSLITKDKLLLNNYISNEKSVNMYCSFCWRLLNKNCFNNTSLNSIYYNIVSNLEAIGDRFWFIGKDQLKKIQVSKFELNLFNQINQDIKFISNNYSRLDLKGLSNFFDSLKNVSKSLKEVSNKENSRVISELREICLLLLEIVYSLIELRVQEL